MPFRSEAQRRKFGELVKEGTMSQAMFDEWNKDTPAKLTERLHPKKVARGHVRPHTPAGRGAQRGR